MQDEVAEEVLLDRARHGDRKALQALIGRHEAPLFSFVQRLVGGRDVAASIFQDAFVLSLTASGPWPARLYRIAVERAREALRLRTRAAETDEEASGRAARRLVNGLPQKLREVFMLRVYQGFSYAVIAQVLECDEATARTRMEHALQHLGEPLLLLADLAPS